ncbi:MAG: hypothetical protein GF329_18865 [Candidatus Lokiarchaeota archaeon]|nr:hypothetical protein [Candidatus Lokiarchaeota archaeon]
MLTKILNEIFGNFKLVSLKSTLIISIIVAVLYINWSRFTPEIIIENDSKVHLSLAQPVQRLTLQFSHKHLVHSYFINQKNPATNKIQTISKIKLGQLLTQLDIDLMNKKILPGQNVLIDIITESDNISINRAMINGSLVMLKDFSYNNIRNKNTRIKNVKLIREDIAGVLLGTNETIGNYILTFLTVLILPITYLLLRKLFLFAFASRFRISILKFIKKNELDADDARIEYGGNFIIEEKLFVFLSIVGPALGFILTISSLIAGLHPSLLTPDKIGHFFEAIQLAMVSTLIGLIIRFESISMLAINRQLLAKFESILNEIKDENKTCETETI